MHGGVCRKVCETVGMFCGECGGVESPVENWLLIESRKACAIKDAAVLIDFVGRLEYVQMSLFRGNRTKVLIT